MNIKTIFATALSLVIASSSIATPVCSCGIFDEGEDLPIIEMTDIAELFNLPYPSAYRNFYIMTDGFIDNNNDVFVLDTVWELSDYNCNSESRDVWVVLNDHGTCEITDDEIVEIFKAPDDYSETLAIFETVTEHMQNSL